MPDPLTYIQHLLLDTACRDGEVLAQPSSRRSAEALRRRKLLSLRSVVRAGAVYVPTAAGRALRDTLPSLNAPRLEQADAMKRRRLVDMTGVKVGSLTCLRMTESDGRGARWICRCDYCGAECVKHGYLLRQAHKRGSAPACPACAERAPRERPTKQVYKQCTLCGQGGHNRATCTGPRACVRCGKTKPAADFYPVKKGSVKRQSRCKKCSNATRPTGAGTGERRSNRFGCELCAGLPHRREKPRCPGCGEPYGDLPPLPRAHEIAEGMQGPGQVFPNTKGM